MLDQLEVLDYKDSPADPIRSEHANAHLNYIVYHTVKYWHIKQFVS